jgi:hypothetical protein
MEINVFLMLRNYNLSTINAFVGGQNLAMQVTIVYKLLNVNSYVI